MFYTQEFYTFSSSLPNFLLLSGFKTSGTSIRLESKYLFFLSDFFSGGGGGEGKRIYFIKVLLLSLRTLLSRFTLMIKLAVELTDYRFTV